MDAGQPPKWVWVALILSPGISMMGMGLVHVAESGVSWVGLVPFVLIAGLGVAVMLAVYGTRGSASPEAARRKKPITLAQFRRNVLGLAIFPVTLLTGAVVALANHAWLVAGVFIAITIPPTLLRAFLIREAWASLHSRQEGSGTHEGPAGHA